MPTPVAPTVMPVPDDTAIQLAKKKQLQAAAASTGRASTFLSDNSGSDTLG